MDMGKELRIIEVEEFADADFLLVDDQIEVEAGSDDPALQVEHT